MGDAKYGRYRLVGESKKDSGSKRGGRMGESSIKSGKGWQVVAL
jgi:hypothetical protein